jgi:hypothetical protein
MGATAGFPHLMFFDPHGEVARIELKAEGGRISEPQLVVMRHLIAAGHGGLCRLLVVPVVALVESAIRLRITDIGIVQKS